MSLVHQLISSKPRSGPLPSATYPSAITRPPVESTSTRCACAREIRLALASLAFMMDRRSPSQLSPPPRRAQFDVEDADLDETSEHATLLRNVRQARSLRPGGIVVGGYKVCPAGRKVKRHPT